MKGLPPKTLLYVEDEEADRFFVGRAFEIEGNLSALQTVPHGRAALEYLSGAGAFADRTRFPVPAVVLLDLNLPEVHGFEVLKRIRAHPPVSKLPVVVFSSSVREEDRMRAMLLGATEFLQKPTSPTVLREIIRSLIQRWLQSPEPPAVQPSASLERSPQAEPSLSR